MRGKKPEITQTIDEIFQHHYFHQKLQQLLRKSTLTNNKDYGSSEVTGLLDDQYYKAEDDVVNQIVDIVHGVVDAQLREVLHQEFINIGQQLDGIKQQIWHFMNEQNKKSEDLTKQLKKALQDVNRKLATSQAMSNTAVVSSNGYSGGIRFIRSGATSSIQASGTGSSINEGKSFHTELIELKKQFTQLKQSLDRGEPMRIIQQQLNQFKIEAKVAIQSLKQNSKKMSVDLGTLSKSVNSNIISPALKQSIENSVRRTISGQLKVYGSYSQKILQLQQQLQRYEQKLKKQGDTFNQYLSNQLKSVWIVVNDMKRNLEDVNENLGMNSSREML